MKKRVTLKDIAEATGFTITTISHALHNKPDISAPTREHICKVAEEMGYITDSAASSLRSGKTNTISIIVPDISNPHISYQVKKIEKEAKKRNYSTIILNTNEDTEIELEAIITSYKKRVDGILICPTQKNTDNIKYIQKLGIPFILIGRFFDNFDTGYVCCDDFKSGYLAGKHMIENGYKNILYIGTHSYITASSKRFSGIKKAILESNKKINLISYTINPNSEQDETILPYLKKVQSSFDSMIVFSDMLAFKIMNDKKNEQTEYFDKMPVVSFDTIQYHLPLPFKHTSVGMLQNSWAKDAFRLLYNEMNDIENPQNKILIDVSIKNF